MSDDTLGLAEGLKRVLDDFSEGLRRASHETLVGVARALMLEVIARGLPCDDACSHLLEGLRKSTSMPRAAQGP